MGVKRPPVEYGAWRAAVGAFWKDAYETPHGMISVDVLRPLQAAPPHEAWRAALTDSKHPVAAALRAADTTPLARSLGEWVTRMRDADPNEFDGAGVAALLVARYIGCGWFEPLKTLREHFGNLDAGARAKVRFSCSRLRV